MDWIGLDWIGLGRMTVASWPITSILTD